VLELLCWQREEIAVQWGQRGLSGAQKFKCRSWSLDLGERVGVFPPSPGEVQREKEEDVMGVRDTLESMEERKSTP
jgi:hypothetical protein